MTIVVGYAPEESGTTALELGGVLARSTGERLIITVVITDPRQGMEPRVAGDFMEPMRDWASKVLAQARAVVPGDLEGDFKITAAESIPSGLIELAEREAASAVVLGSSGKSGLGRIFLGSITDRLAHAADRPLLLAPRGFRAGPDDRIRRVNLAYGGSREGGRAAAYAIDLADRIGAELRAVSLTPRPPREIYQGVEDKADDLVASTWAARLRESLRQQTAPLGEVSERLADSLVVAEGTSWADAISRVSWRTGDLLVLGPSSLAPAARLFLGSRASKIVRASPVPVLLVPAPAA